MLRPIRTAVSVAVLVAALWAAFAIDLGGHTFAEHVDTISDTPEAKQLIEGTRSTVNPALQEVRDRVLGEYVEAPTWLPGEPTDPAVPTDQAPPEGSSSVFEPMVPASALPPGTAFEPALPGARRRTPTPTSDDSDGGASEPSLPGRR